MKVKLAKTAGFCMGVRRAMEMVLTEANRGKTPLFTFGPLIHNHQVLDLLASKGIKAVDNVNGLENCTLVIRAHGITPQGRLQIKQTGLKVIDATCPKVARVQAIIRYQTKKGSTAIIFGNKDHAEVTALMGYSATPARVVQSVKDVSALPHLEEAFVVSQTTQNEKSYEEVVNALRERFPNLKVFHTICDATQSRQQEVRSFAGQVDATVIVGGFHSGNTQRLVQVSKEAGLPTFHVETEKDLDIKRLSGMKAIGITAGASTPNWMIKKVVNKIEGIRGRKETAFTRWPKRALKFLLVNNIIVASGAFCFSHAATVLLDKPPNLTFPMLAFLYIYAMHVLNRFLDRGASAYNDPERAAFLNKHRHMLIVTGIAAVVLALYLAYSIGIKTFFALCGLSIIGIAYSLPLVPSKLQHKYPYSKIKDIPGSRSLSESLAWAAVIVFLPLLEMEKVIWPVAVVSFLSVLSMSYVRSVMFDIFQLQGDLIVGTETLPITLGERKTLVLVKIILLSTGLILAGSPVMELTNHFSYLLLLPLFSLSLCVVAYENRWLYPGILLEALLEGNFYLAGLLALIWQIL